MDGINYSTQSILAGRRAPGFRLPHIADSLWTPVESVVYLGWSLSLAMMTNKNKKKDQAMTHKALCYMQTSKWAFILTY